MKMDRTASIISISVLFLVLIGFLAYPYIRYEKATVGRVDIKYDRFSGAIYTKNSHLRNSQWTLTDFKTMREAKEYLAKKEVEENLEEARKGLSRKPKRSNDLNEKTRYY